MHLDAEFYVTLGFIIFVLLLGYLGVHRRLTAALDARAARVRAELAEAKRLHDEAQALLDGFSRKAAAAEAEAAAIVAQARREAEALAKETEARMSEFVARRTRQAQDKIATAEAQAAAEVRAAAADLAVRAAETVLRRDPKGTGAADLVARDIAGLKARLH